MKKILILLLFFLATVSLKAQTFINQPYFFMSSEEAQVIMQTQDTLRVYTGFIPMRLDWFKHHKGKKNYKIIKTLPLEADYFALKLKNLNPDPPTPMTPNADKKRFELFIFKKQADTISLVFTKTRLNINEIKHYNLDTLDYKKAFGFSFYSLDYMKKLNKLKHIKTVTDYNQFEANLEKNIMQYADLLNDYKNNFRGIDMYNSGLTGLLLTKYAIDSGICPIYLGLIGIIATDKRKTEAEKQKKIQWVYKKYAPDNL